MHVHELIQDFKIIAPVDS